MQISVLDPLSRALNRMTSILFKPFDFQKWLLLGFCSFLAALGRDGVGGNIPSDSFSGRTSGAGKAAGNALEWMSENIVLLILLVLAFFLVIIAINLLLQWLGSRGEFMFLDGVVQDRGAVKQPWAEFRNHANSFFLLKMALIVISLIVFLSIFLLSFLIALIDISRNEFGGFALLAVLLGALLMIPCSIIFALINMALHDFVAPIMYRRGLPAMDAVAVFRQEFLSITFWKIILFWVIKFVLVVACASTIMVLTCATCCVAGIPYISSVIFLPIAVFFRAYDLYFMEQFGPDWQFFIDDTPQPQARYQNPSTETEAYKPGPFNNE
ncbi:MAG: hypothetical protein ACLFUS_13415 [Candidatus Sumerlaeia bacterium]